MLRLHGTDCGLAGGCRSENGVGRIARDDCFFPCYSYV